jgi:hypothetical protein
MIGMKEKNKDPKLASDKAHPTEVLVPVVATGTPALSKPLRFNRHWQQFVFCLILTLVWPLLPLGFEWLTTNKIRLDSITLAASMYAIGIGVSSKNIALFGVALLQGFIFCLFYGLTISNSNPPHYDLYWRASIIGMLLMFLSHAVERYNRHVRLREEFPDFIKAN